MPSTNRLLSIWKGLALNNRRSAQFVEAEDIAVYARRAEAEGAEFYARQMARLRKDFLFSLESGMFSTSARFGRRKNSVLPQWLYKAWSAIFADDGTLLSIVNVDAVTCVNQLTAVFTKIRGGHTPESESAVIETFLKTEADMAQWELDLDQKLPCWQFDGVDPKRMQRTLGEILTVASHRIKRVLAGSDPREISPKHGSGVSACSTPKSERYAVPRFVEKIDGIWPMSEYFFASATAFCDSLDEYLQAPVYDPCAKVLLVPKDARGPRLISCEPRETMWIQQGLMSRMYEDIEEHDLTRGLVNFTDQTENQLAAYHGSHDHGTQYIASLSALEGASEAIAMLSLTGAQRDAVQGWREAKQKTEMYLSDRGLFPLSLDDVPQKVGTLDLTNASDKLHLSVVTHLFPENWGRALSACRSAKTKLPDGRMVPLTKHAPMGSAVCFPVMALVIWSVLTAIAPAHAAKRLLVYGDDIVVPSFMAEDAMLVLEAIGFEINRGKSFYRGPFRESCGEEFFRGCRVTPVYLREDPDDDTRSKLCMFAFCNNLLQGAACVSNCWMIDLLTEWYGDKFPIAYLAKQYRADWFGYAESAKLAVTLSYSTLTGVVYTDDRTKVRYPAGPRRTRWCSDTQVRLYLVRVPEPLCREYDTGDWSHVLHSLVNPEIRGLGREPIHNRIRYVYRWCRLN